VREVEVENVENVDKGGKFVSPPTHLLSLSALAVLSVIFLLSRPD
jgi:hypothetical protein